MSKNKLNLNQIESSTKIDKEWFVLGLFSVVAIITVSILLLFIEKDTQLYYYGNNGLFLICVILFIELIATTQNVKMQFTKLLNILKIKQGLNLEDYGHGLNSLSYLLAFVSFLFILDMSFISHYGVRISGVVGVLLFRLIKISISKR